MPKFVIGEKPAYQPAGAARKVFLGNFYFTDNRDLNLHEEIKTANHTERVASVYGYAAKKGEHIRAFTVFGTGQDVGHSSIRNGRTTTTLYRDPDKHMTSLPAKKGCYHGAYEACRILGFDCRVVMMDFKPQTLQHLLNKYDIEVCGLSSWWELTNVEEVSHARAESAHS